MARVMHQWLLDHQNPDGGWGYAPGRRSNLEATSLALLALLGHAAGVAGAARACAWVRERRTPQGGFAGWAGEEQPSWATPLALIALCRAGADPEARAAGLGWLLSATGQEIANHPDNEIDGGLRGWSWFPGTFSWVEPTAYALLALKTERRGGEARVAEGERMLLDRMCTGGGWNYGNRRVLGVDLVPFDQVTAKALIALQDRRDSPGVNACAEQLLAADPRRHRSIVTRAWETLARSAWGHPLGDADKAVVAENLDADRDLDAGTLAFALAAIVDAGPAWSPFTLTPQGKAQGVDPGKTK